MHSGPAPGGAGVCTALPAYTRSHAQLSSLIRSQELKASAWGKEGVPISGFGADVSRARAFRRWLFVEADALAFVQLLERTSLHRASVEEPLLAAIVADKTKSAISDQPFNRSVRHVDVPPRTVDGPS